MNKIGLDVIGLTFSHSQSGAYALILGDKNTGLKLPIIIGSIEAQSIAMALENQRSRRPLTHDLFKAFAENYGIKVKEVVVNSFKEGIFTSQLVCDKDGDISVFDARTSDSIALAVRFGCPIFTTEEVMNEAGLMMDDLVGDDGNDDTNDSTVHSIGELKEMMAKAVEDEDYELASKLRDEINSREIK
ncbi:MAG: bifunctional nuclease family protein [Bacteroidales bacterium]|nr:bifunctional nuclease family protein [Bacteroidales bacterium]